MGVPRKVGRFCENKYRACPWLVQAPVLSTSASVSLTFTWTAARFCQRAPEQGRFAEDPPGTGMILPPPPVPSADVLITLTILLSLTWGWSSDSLSCAARSLVLPHMAGGHLAPSHGGCVPRRLLLALCAGLGRREAMG